VFSVEFNAVVHVIFLLFFKRALLRRVAPSCALLRHLRRLRYLRHLRPFAPNCAVLRRIALKCTKIALIALNELSKEDAACMG
jgi:hypothetical protein